MPLDALVGQIPKLPAPPRPAPPRAAASVRRGSVRIGCSKEVARWTPRRRPKSMLAAAAARHWQAIIACLGESKPKMAHERRHPKCSPACWVTPGARSGEHCRLARSGEAPNGRLIQAGTDIERPSGPAVRLPPGPDGP